MEAAYCISRFLIGTHTLVEEFHFNPQGHQKQSADGQAQRVVSGEAANNLRAKRAAEFWT